MYTLYCLLMWLVMQCLTETVFSCTHLPRHQCEEPSEYGHVNADDYIQIARAQTTNIMTNLRVEETTDNVIPDEYINVSYDDFPSNIVCYNTRRALTRRRDRRSKRSQQDHVYPLNTIATCPWVYRTNIDENRRPKMMVEAACACLHEQGSDVYNTCQNVYQYVRVFRRTGCVCGQNTYRWAWEKLAVACVAARNPSHVILINDVQRMGV